MAGRYDFEIVPGTTFSRSLVWNDENGVPVDLTGWSAHMQIRTWPLEALAADLSTSGSGIILGSGGTIALTIAAAVTAKIRPGVAKYDLFLTNLTPATSCLLYGDVIVRRGVTQ